MKLPLPPGRFNRLSPEEMARRRLDSLCFNCLDKFTREHAKQCTMRGIYYLEVGDGEPDDTAPTSEEEDLMISMHVLSGIRTGSTISLATMVAACQFSALIDSGSTHCFIAAKAARHLGLQPVSRPGVTVGVANGDRVPLAGVCKDVVITIGTEEFTVDLHAIDLHDYEIVLG